MNYGIIDLDNFLSKRSYERLKAQYYIYDKLFTYNFDSFKQLQLHSFHGSKTHFDNVNLLVEQNLIEPFKIDGAGLDYEKSKNIVTILENVSKGYWNKLNTFNESTNPEIIFDNLRLGTAISGLKERLFAQLVEQNVKQQVHPISSIDCFNFDLKTIKSDVYCVLINNIPIPEASTPLHDILEYKNLDSNKLRFFKLKKWVNNIAQSGLSIQEINEEIECLIQEYKEEMRLAGIKMRNARIEFAVKLVPELIENIFKFNWSKIGDSSFKLRHEKVSLLESELKATGNELAYIINI